MYSTRGGIDVLRSTDDGAVTSLACDSSGRVYAGLLGGEIVRTTAAVTAIVSEQATPALSVSAHPNPAACDITVTIHLPGATTGSVARRCTDGFKFFVPS